MKNFTDVRKTMAGEDCRGFRFNANNALNTVTLFGFVAIIVWS